LPEAPHSETQSTPVQRNSDSSGEKRGWNENHILWVIPNYRSDQLTDRIEPLTPKQKFMVATSDSLDPSGVSGGGSF
jgi:hypothetical protein